MTEDEMVGWHHRLNGHEFEQAPGDGEEQGSHRDLGVVHNMLCHSIPQGCTNKEALLPGTEQNGSVVR